MSAQTDSDIARVLTFWFDHTEGVQKWFTPNSDFDNDCRESCAQLVDQARASGLDLWKSTPDGSLALIILLDQIPRNIFRGSPESYSSDAMARDLAIYSISQGFDRQIPVDRQMFFYLPFMHGEDMLTQVASLGLFQGLAARTKPATQLRRVAEDAIEFSQKHMNVINDFGRFPSRNRSLGRESTKEEEDYLQRHPSGF